jgi:TrpR family trp operon transcriptional repressor
MSVFIDFIDLIYSIRDKELLADFLMGVTTEQERTELVRRIEIIKRLLAGEPHAKIARDLGVGVATVTRGSKELASGRFKVLRSQHE